LAYLYGIETRVLKQSVKRNLKRFEGNDFNDINEDTRLQLELINESLAELQTKHKALNKPIGKIGFVIPGTEE